MKLVVNSADVEDKTEDRRLTAGELVDLVHQWFLL
jgi:hypothetical protein